MKPSILLSAAWLLAASSALGEGPETLSQTAPLDWPERDLSAKLMDGAHGFVERNIAESATRRTQFWKRDFSSAEAYARSIQTNRERFRTVIGVVDSRLPARMELFGDDVHGPLIAETSRYRVSQVRWPVLDGFSGEGLLVQPKGEAVGHVIALADADQTPEQLIGLAPGSPLASQVARRLAKNGFEILVPTLVDRERLKTDDPQLRASDQSHREWIYRQAYHMGRHVIGYEVQTVLAAADWFRQRYNPNATVGLCGYGEGALVSFYAAAVDSRIAVVLVSGYFDSRQAVWSEPIYRNVWGLLREFGDAELASLILPRTLIVEYSPAPSIRGQKGEWRTPLFSSVAAEVGRVETGSIFRQPIFIHGENGTTVPPFSDVALAAFASRLGVDKLLPLSGELPVDARDGFSPVPRQQRLVQAMENHVQSLVGQSDQVRDQFFLYKVLPELADSQWSTARRHPTHPPEKFIEGAKAYRRLFREEAMGRFDESVLPFHARTRKVAESPKWTAYDVVLDVWPEVFAWGVLVLPKDIKPGERRPVVVCQHGRDGLPRDTIDGNKSAYNNFASALAERGFITFAPHNLYRGEDRYRWLNRKANSVKATLFTFIIVQHEQILRWLETRPEVDATRIAFYGLSYGGETAVRVPPILEGYCLSICSGDFNQWTRKVAATDQPFSFMRTIEWEMPYWNLGCTFDYAEMAYLMVPRPFMVERGHLDRVGRDPWVAYEYAKVRWLYGQLGLADRTQIEFFQGGHSINGEGTFDFLHRHLNWPVAKSANP